jgi:hypothetical protein
MARYMSWIDDLSPEEAQAAIHALDAHKGAITVREGVELRRLRIALKMKAEQTCKPAQFPLCTG